MKTSGLIQDSSWHHVQVSVNTDASVAAADRVQIVVDGVRETSFTGTTPVAPSDNALGQFNGAVTHELGRNAVANGNYFSGSIADVRFVDGATVPTFGELDGESWRPSNGALIDHGANGFHLDFADDTDFGGNTLGTNGFSASNLSSSNRVSVGDPVNLDVTTASTSASQWTGASTFTYGSGTLSSSGNDYGVRSVEEFAGDVRLEFLLGTTNSDTVTFGMFDVTEDGNFAADGGMAARFGIDDMTNGLAVYADGAIYVGGRVLDTGAPATGWTDTTRLIRIERIGSTFSILQETTAGSGAFTTVHTVQDYTSSNAIRIGSGGMNSRTNVSWTALNGMGTVELPHGKEIAIAPTAGDDRIEGTTDDDTIDGGAGDDRIIGNAGNDTINGGGGNDTVVFGGDAGDYAIRYFAESGTFQVHDNDLTIDDGTDTLSNVQTLTFADGSKALDNPVSAHDSAARLQTESSVAGNLDVSQGEGSLTYAIEAAGNIVDTATANTLGFDTNEGEVRETASGNGYVQVRGDGTYKYKPKGVYAGEDSFEYRVTDERQIHSIASVTVSVGGIATPSEGADAFSGDATDDVIRGLGGDDTLNGVDGDDILTGGMGDDVLIGGQGDDMLAGGAGIDIAEYAGASGNYDIFYDSVSGTYKVVDNVGTDGTDTLMAVEKVRFTGDAGDPVVSDLSDPTQAFTGYIHVAEDGVASWRLHADGSEDTLTFSVETSGNSLTIAEATTLGFNMSNGDVFETDYGHIQVQSNGTYEYRPDAGHSGTDTFDFRVTNTDQVSTIASIAIDVGGTGTATENKRLPPRNGVRRYA